jgi:8-oxo-dGTP diphosphatase
MSDEKVMQVMELQKRVPNNRPTNRVLVHIRRVERARMRAEQAVHLVVLTELNSVWRRLQPRLKSLEADKMARFGGAGRELSKRLSVTDEDLWVGFQDKLEARVKEAMEQHVVALADVEHYKSSGHTVNMDPKAIVAKYEAYIGVHHDREIKDIAAGTAAKVASMVAAWYNTPGRSIQDLQEDLSPYFNQSRASNVATTEVTYLNSEVQADVFHQLGVKTFWWMTHRDELVCVAPHELNGVVWKGCKELHGQVFKVGEHMPPLHPRCRCTPVANEEPVGPGERELVGDWAIGEQENIQAAPEKEKLGGSPLDPHILTSEIAEWTKQAIETSQKSIDAAKNLQWAIDGNFVSGGGAAIIVGVEQQAQADMAAVLAVYSNPNLASDAERKELLENIQALLDDVQGVGEAAVKSQSLLADLTNISYGLNGLNDKQAEINLAMAAIFAENGSEHTRLMQIQGQIDTITKTILYFQAEPYKLTLDLLLNIKTEIEHIEAEQSPLSDKADAAMADPAGYAIQSYGHKDVEAWHGDLETRMKALNLAVFKQVYVSKYKGLVDVVDPGFKIAWKDVNTAKSKENAHHAVYVPGDAPNSELVDALIQWDGQLNLIEPEVNALIDNLVQQFGAPTGIPVKSAGLYVKERAQILGKADKTKARLKDVVDKWSLTMTQLSNMVPDYFDVMQGFMDAYEKVKKDQTWEALDGTGQLQAVYQLAGAIDWVGVQLDLVESKMGAAPALSLDVQYQQANDKWNKVLTHYHNIKNTYHPLAGAVEWVGVQLGGGIDQLYEFMGAQLEVDKQWSKKKADKPTILSRFNIIIDNFEKGLVEIEAEAVKAQASGGSAKGPDVEGDRAKLIAKAKEANTHWGDIVSKYNSVLQTTAANDLVPGFSAKTSEFGDAYHKVENQTSWDALFHDERLEALNDLAAATQAIIQGIDQVEAACILAGAVAAPAGVVESLDVQRGMALANSDTTYTAAVALTDSMSGTEKITAVFPDWGKLTGEFINAQADLQDDGIWNNYDNAGKSNLVSALVSDTKQVLDAIEKVKAFYGRVGAATLTELDSKRKDAIAEAKAMQQEADEFAASLPSNVGINDLDKLVPDYSTLLISHSEVITTLADDADWASFDEHQKEYWVNRLEDTSKELDGAIAMLKKKLAAIINMPVPVGGTLDEQEQTAYENGIKVKARKETVLKQLGWTAKHATAFYPGWLTLVGQLATWLNIIQTKWSTLPDGLKQNAINKLIEATNIMNGLLDSMETAMAGMAPGLIPGGSKYAAQYAEWHANYGVWKKHVDGIEAWYDKSGHMNYMSAGFDTAINAAKDMLKDLNVSLKFMEKDLNDDDQPPVTQHWVTGAHDAVAALLDLWTNYTGLPPVTSGDYLGSIKSVKVPWISQAAALDMDKLKKGDPHHVLLGWANPGSTPRYGGVVFDDQGRIMLRSPKNKSKGYNWTFSIGKQLQGGEHSSEAALRQVKEEMWEQGEIVGVINKQFGGTGAESYFYLMRSAGTDAAAKAAAGYTEDTRWATYDEAMALIGTSLDDAGRKRDWDILDEAFKEHQALLGGQVDYSALLKAPPLGPSAAARRAKQIGPLPAVKDVYVRHPEFPAGLETLQKVVDEVELAKVRDLGGTTGAHLYVDPATKKQYVMKDESRLATSGEATAGHLEEEARTDAAYRAMGVNVPKSCLYRTSEGKTVKLAEFIEGRTWKEATKSGVAEKKLVEQMQKGFAADAVLGNWDVTGADWDNLLVDKEGKVWRIDNGSGMRYRAQGGKKGEGKTEPLESVPWEIWGMRNRPGTTGGAIDHAVELYRGMSYKEVVDSMRNVVKSRDAVLAEVPADLQELISDRIQNLSHLVKAHDNQGKTNWKDDYRDNFGHNLMELHGQNVHMLMPQKFNSTFSGGSWDVEVRDETGKPYDGLYGKDALIQTFKNYVEQNGGNWDTIQEWAGSQAWSSWTSIAKAVKYWIGTKTGADPLDEYYWGEDDPNNPDARRVALEECKVKYEDFRVQHPDVDRTLSLLHSFTYETLSSVEFPHKNEVNGTVLVLRTEEHNVFTKNKVSKTSGEKKVVKFRRGAVESCSLLNPVSVRGQELTETEVPLSDILGVYWMGRSGGASQDGDHLFLGSNENEFVCVLGSKETRWTGKYLDYFKDVPEAKKETYNTWKP